MVAEPVTEQELPTSPVEVPESPEPTPEPEAEQDDVPEEAVSAFLKEQKFLPAEESEESAGDEALADDDGPEWTKLSPQQAYELGQQRGSSETINATQSESARQAAQARVEGARNTLRYSRDSLARRLTDAGNSADTVLAAVQDLDNVNGLWTQVYQADVAAAQSAGAGSFGAQVRAAVPQVLGAKAKDALGVFDALPPHQQTPEAFLRAVTDKAREGYLSPSEKGKEFTRQWQGWLKNLTPEKRKAVMDTLGFNPAMKTSSQAGQATGRYRTKAEAAALHVQGKITSAEMRQINADPSIPSGL